MFSRNGSGGFKLSIIKQDDMGWWQLGAAIALIIALVALAVVLLPGCVAEEEPVPRSYNCTVYTEQGCEKFVVASGGELEVQDGGTLDVQDGASVDFSGGVDLDGATLTIDADADTTLVASDDDVVSMTIGAAAGYFDVLTGNFKVGDGSPDTSLDGEDAYVEGTLEVDGAVDLDGAVDMASTLDVAGAATLDGGLTMDTDKFVVTDSTGDTTIAGTLDVDGDVDMDDVDISGDLTVAGDFLVTGHTLITTTTTITGDTTVAGTLDVSGVATLGGGTDLNGTTLTIDADADTTLVASDDDVVSMTIGAAAGYFDVLTGNFKVGDGSPDTSLDGEDAYVEGTLEVDGAVDLDGAVDVAGNVTLGDAIGDNVYVYGQMRSYDGDNWADIADVSALGRGNGWHAAYKITGWGGATQFQALFANAQISDTMGSGTTAYGIEGKMTASNGENHLGTGYGVFGKLTAKDADTQLAAGYPVYSIVDVNDSAVITTTANYFAELSGEATIGTVSVLQAKSGDTWDYGMNLSGATVSTAEIVGQNGETIKNDTDTAWQIGGFTALEEASAVDLGAGFTLTPTASYQPVTNSTAGSITSDGTTAIADGPVAGAILIVVNEDDQDIVFQDTANIKCGGNITLTASADDSMMLLWDGSDWVCLGMHDN